MRELPDKDQDIKAWAKEERIAEKKAQMERREREIERLEYEEAERQRKLEEREAAEQLRLEAERLRFYSRLETIDFAVLSLDDYPNDVDLRTAKKSRTLWYIILSLALFLFLLSLFQLTFPWVGGIAGGLAFVVWLTHGLKIVNFFPSLTNYNRLLSKRRNVKRGLIEYIQQLEGAQGFMHQLYPLSEYNQRLASKRYRHLINASAQGQLTANLRTLEDTMEYQKYMKEALKAYREMQIVVEEQKRRAVEVKEEQDAVREDVARQEAKEAKANQDKAADSTPAKADDKSSATTSQSAQDERKEAKKAKKEAKKEAKKSTHQLETTSTYYSKDADKAEK